MCILSLYKSKEQTILTHNRDEDFNRISSQKLITKEINGVTATYPEDLKSQGTWILTSDVWTTAILNGAEEPHQRKSKYKHSRGKFPFQLLEFEQAKDYFQSLELEGIEPFTQIILNHKNQNAWIFRWNEIEKIYHKIENELFVTSSGTLYTQQEKNTHLKAFQHLKSINADSLSQVHQNLFWKKNPSKPKIKTTSMVQVYINKGFKSMNYKNMRMNTNSI